LPDSSGAIGTLDESSNYNLLWYVRSKM